MTWSPRPQVPGIGDGVRPSQTTERGGKSRSKRKRTLSPAEGDRKYGAVLSRFTHGESCTPGGVSLLEATQVTGGYGNPSGLSPDTGHLILYIPAYPGISVTRRFVKKVISKIA